MSYSPEQIATRRFVVALRGYDKDEVDAFLAEVGDQVAELLREGSDREVTTEPDDAAERPEPHEPGDEAFTRYGAQLGAVMRAAVAAAQEIGDRAAEEVAALRAAAARDAQQHRDEAERAVAEERKRWEEEREEMASAAAAARQQGEQQLEESRVAAAEALRSARASEEAAKELRDSASRELANAQAQRLAAEEEASALMVRAANEAEQYRREVVELLQKSLGEISTITTSLPTMQFNSGLPTEPVTTSGQSEAPG